MLHRDDIPFEEIERIEAMLKERHPDEDYRIFFPGDMPPDKVPQEIKDAIAAMEAREEESVELGCCLSCDDLISDYRPADEDWFFPDGWMCMVDESDRIHGWRCPVCCEKMGAGEFSFNDNYDDDEDVDPDERWTTTDPDQEWTGSDSLDGDFE